MELRGVIRSRSGLFELGKLFFYNSFFIHFSENCFELYLEIFVRAKHFSCQQVLVIVVIFEEVSKQRFYLFQCIPFHKDSGVLHLVV